MNNKITIDVIRCIAKSKGGKCLSKNFKNVLSKIEMVCKKNHKWTTVPWTIYNNHWCPYCAHCVKLTIDEIKNIAISKDGKCLFKKYVNSQTKLKFRCNKDGYIWYCVPNSIKLGYWCPKCAGKIKGTIEEMQKIAKSKYGMCLSKRYVNAKTPLLFQCNKDKYIWKAAPDCIKNNNSWCPMCAGKKITIKDMQKLAESKGGRCLSKKYVNIYTPLRWICEYKHRWNAKPNSIRNSDVWCPECSKRDNINENLCRKILETKFNKKFPNKKHSWLKNINNLELDGYCKELNLAFEYNGIQHYQIDGFFNKNKNDLKKIQERDKLKINICKSKEIDLIIIPYTIKYNDIAKFIYAYFYKTKRFINQDNQLI